MEPESLGSVPLSAYRGMWLFALFDLPVKTKPQKRAYVRFRTHLLRLGFMQLQFSVYAYFCTNEDSNAAKRRSVRSRLPDEGQVRLISITDRQFSQMDLFLGKSSEEPEEPLGQVLLF